VVGERATKTKALETEEKVSGLQGVTLRKKMEKIH
jgi:hypothetical protein